jgi:hypothetical protein
VRIAPFSLGERAVYLKETFSNGLSVAVEEDLGLRVGVGNRGG